MKEKKEDSKDNGQPKIKAIELRKHTSRTNPLDYEIVSDETVDFTKEKAFAFLELEKFAGERDARDLHVQYLYDEESAGNFMWHLVNIAMAEMDGKMYRINGQHTAWMRVNADRKGKTPVREIVYKVDSSEDLRRLYSVFDRNAPRTVAHVSKVQLLGTEATVGIPGGYLGHLIAGYRLFHSPGWAGSMTRANRSGSLADMLTKIKTEHAQLFNIVGKFFVQHYEDWMPIRRASVTGPMFATFEKAVKASLEFWTPVVEGTNLDKKSDVRWQLRRFIEGHGHTLHRNKDMISQEDLYRICINMWNHWRSGNEVTKIRLITGEDRPKVRA